MVSSRCGSRPAAPVDGGQRQHLGHLLDAIQVHPLVRGVEVRAHRAVAGGRGVPVEVEETDVRRSREGEEPEVVVQQVVSAEIDLEKLRRDREEGIPPMLKDRRPEFYRRFLYTEAEDSAATP